VVYSPLIYVKRFVPMEGESFMMSYWGKLITRSLHRESNKEIELNTAFMSFMSIFIDFFPSSAIQQVFLVAKTFGIITNNYFTSIHLDLTMWIDYFLWKV